MEPLIAYLHVLTFILTGAFLTAEMVVCRPDLTVAQVRALPRLDILFFAAALLALATGLLRLFVYAKGVSFYLPNPFFWAKMALYVAIALISIRPTLAFIRWNRAMAGGGAAPPAEQVAGVRRLLHLELGLFALIPLMAVLMARGIGR